jgi:polyhydroxybutyrate depolymerase
MKKFLFILFVVCFQLTIVYGQYDTIDVDGVKRTYKLAVPDLYTGSDSVPMVIGLHYLGSNGSQFESSTDFSVLGARENFISVYPNGLNGAWNGGGCCNPAVEDNVDDVGFV